MITFDPTYLAQFQENFRLCQTAVDNLVFTRNGLQDFFPLTGERLSQVSPESLERLDALTGRFSRLQDLMGERLFRSLMFLEGESRPRFLDVLNLMESRGIVVSSQQWMELRNMRNEASHGYLEDPSQLAMVLTTLFNRSGDLIESFSNLKRYVREVLKIAMNG